MIKRWINETWKGLILCSMSPNFTHHEGRNKIKGKVSSCIMMGYAPLTHPTIQEYMK